MIKVRVRDLTQDGLVLGYLVQPNHGEPFGTTDMLDQMLAQDRVKQFKMYAAGWSNGYTVTEQVKP